VKKLTKEPKKINRTAHALRRLHITPQQMAAVPQITPLLKQADGGMDQILTAMRFSPDEVIAAFLEKYDVIPVGDRDNLPIEAIAMAAGVDIRHLLGSILVALQAQSVSAVKIIALTAHPKITQARVVYGQHPLGERDRTALDTAMGLLPSPKGPTFIGKAIFGSGRDVMDQQRGGDEDNDTIGDSDGPDMDRLFPPANAMQEKLTPIRQERMLPRGQ
jgi:hypothetical protein